MRRLPLLWLIVLASLLSGCGLVGGLRADPIASSAQKPSNVAVYVAVHHGDRAARGLTEKSFRIYEDGQPLDPGQTQQTLLPRDVAAVHQAMLLVDLSGDLSDEDKDRLAEATGRFVTRVRKGQPVAVHAFDGGPRLRQLGTYPKGEQEVEKVGGITGYRAQDPSSNLHSAVVEAIEQLEVRLARQKPIRVGTLVVLVRSPDLAGRVTVEDMEQAVDETSHHVLAVELEGVDAPARSIGRDGVFTASSLSSVGLALDDAARSAEELLERYYLLSYCSPARAGARAVRVEVTAVDDEGKEVSGSFDTEFDATGFTSGCNPKTTPRFVIPPKPVEDDGSDAAPAQRGTGGGAPGSAAAPPDDGSDIAPPPNEPGYAQ